MREPAPTVLVIEDEAPVRRFLRTTLSGHGFQVFEAPTGQEGLAQAQSRNPEIILLDLGLPDLDGLVVTRKLREWTTVPVIVLSALPAEPVLYRRIPEERRGKEDEAQDRPQERVEDPADHAWRQEREQDEQEWHCGSRLVSRSAHRFSWALESGQILKAFLRPRKKFLSRT